VWIEGLKRIFVNGMELAAIMAQRRVVEPEQGVKSPLSSTTMVLLAGLAFAACATAIGALAAATSNTLTNRNRSDFRITLLV